MSVPHKLQIKIGSAEFLAEGSESTVKEQFQQFLDAISALAPEAKPRRRLAASDDAGEDGEEGGGLETSLTQTMIEEAFMVDRSGKVSLRAMPDTDNREPDTLVLLIYGYRVLRNQLEVNAGTLTEAARTSGLTLNRVDRVVVQYNHLIRRGGKKRGVRYSLNNQGMAHAEGIIKEMYR